MTVKKYKYQYDGSFITVDKITGTFSIGDREGLKEVFEALIPRNEIDRWRPLAEKFGMGAILDQAEGLLDSTGYSTDHHRFRELMKEAIDGMLKIDREEVKNLARRGLSFKESKRGEGYKAQAWRDEIKKIAESVVQDGREVNLPIIISRIQNKVGDESFWQKVIQHNDGTIDCFYTCSNGTQGKVQCSTIDKNLSAIKKSLLNPK